MDWQPELDELRRREQLAYRLGSEERVAPVAAAEDPAALRTEIAARLDAKRFSVEEIIDPRETRPLLCTWAERAHELVRQELHAGPKRRGPQP